MTPKFLAGSEGISYIYFQLFKEPFSRQSLLFCSRQPILFAAMKKSSFEVVMWDMGYLFWLPFSVILFCLFYSQIQAASFPIKKRPVFSQFWGFFPNLRIYWDLFPNSKSQPIRIHTVSTQLLKTFAVEDNFKFCRFFKNNEQGMIFHENCLLADDSHEISCLVYYFLKNRKDIAKFVICCSCDCHFKS